MDALKIFEPLEALKYLLYFPAMTTVGYLIWKCAGFIFVMTTIALLFAFALHFAPAVSSTGEEESVNVLSVSWNTIGILGAIWIGSLITRFVIGALFELLYEEE